MRDLREAAKDSKKKAEKELRRTAARSQRNPDSEFDQEDGEHIIAGAVRADGSRAEPRTPAPRPARQGFEDPDSELDDEDPEDPDDYDEDPDEEEVPEEITTKLKGKKIHEIGGKNDEMASFKNLEDGEVRPRRDRRERVPEERPRVQRQRMDPNSGRNLVRGATLLKEAKIKSVEVDLALGTVVALVVILAGDKKPTRVMFDVQETGQVYLKVPR